MVETGPSLQRMTREGWVSVESNVTWLVSVSRWPDPLVFVSSCGSVCLLAALSLGRQACCLYCRTCRAVPHRLIQVLSIPFHPHPNPILPEPSLWPLYHALNLPYFPVSSAFIFVHYLHDFLHFSTLCLWLSAYQIRQALLISTSYLHSILHFFLTQMSSKFCILILEHLF